MHIIDLILLVTLWVCVVIPAITYAFYRILFDFEDIYYQSDGPDFVLLAAGPVGFAVILIGNGIYGVAAWAIAAGLYLAHRFCRRYPYVSDEQYEAANYMDCMRMENDSTYPHIFCEPSEVKRYPRLIHG